MKVNAWWLLLALIVGLSAAYIYYKVFYIPIEVFSINKRKNYDVITLSLPNNPVPTVFGPKYWEAYHKLTENIPCPGCRSKAVPFISFFHDVVNKQKDKPIFDPDNFNRHIDLISNLTKA